MREILDIVALVVIAALSEESVVDDFVDVELVQQRVSILQIITLVLVEPLRRSDKTHLRDRRCEHYNLVQLANSLHELIDAWSLYHIDVVVVTLNLDRDGEVGLMQNLSNN